MSTQRPHIIILCPDEMRASAVAAWGNPAVATPSIDGLAARSIKFDRAFTNHTKCTPSRCSFLTSQYPHVGGHRTLDMPVRAHEVNLVRYLRENYGYRTALVGKNHCVDDETQQLTFDFRGRGEGGDGYLDPYEETGMPTGSYYVGKDPRKLSEHGDYTSTTMAIDWLRDEINDDPDTPRLLWLNWDHPHCPYRAPEPFHGITPRDKVPDAIPPIPEFEPLSHTTLREAYGVADMTPEQWRELHAVYLDMTTMVDADVKRVLDTVEQLGIADNTIIVFWSDHGDFAGDYGLPEKWDTCFSDNLVHVPLIIHAPNTDASAYNGLTETIDILPTVLDLAGIPAPGGIQGRSHRDAIRGNTDQPVRDVVFTEGGQEPELLERVTPVDARPRPCQAYLMKQQALVNEPQINLRSKMIRGDRYKYVARLDGDEQLFDLENDPHEHHDLARSGDAEDILNTMRRRMMLKLMEAENNDPDQDYLDS
ncbi:sulfatase-like hydrolase/transferase [Mucisphaera calidilacus]|uniref:Choline-sulfatase n=1 Tax=Mucisphaera calidilacus TaxID=2527982 RepID=A0A518BUF3_9BACT|nr:sulfatase-like hydrolase/transferase [Mucisphaera calidilacus]QDU70619.1 Choline-sulfatase [Mucisphaera calidilacus]